MRVLTYYIKKVNTIYAQSSVSEIATIGFSNKKGLVHIFVRDS